MARRVARLFPVVRVLAVLVVAFHAASAQHGRIVTDTVRSASLANLLGAPAETRVSTYLPPGYDASPLARFPVVYLLHGYPASDLMWSAVPGGVDIAGVMDSLIAAHGSREMIVVMPNASNPFGGSFYTNSTTTGHWEDFIVHDLVSYIDGKLRTLARPESRGLAGLSMGGYGALYLGALHGGATYSAIYAMSPCCTARWSFDPARDGAMWDSITSFTSIRASQRNGQAFATRGLMAVAAAFSPNANRPPLFLDLPVDHDGPGWKPNAAVVAKWDAHSPLLMIPSHRDNLLGLRAIQFDVGLQDEIVPLGEMTMLDSAFSRAAIPHTFETYTGAHTGHTRDRLATRVLPFFSRVLVFEAKQ
jgi:S-formylglutathione hydrolase FrmB